MSYKFDIGEHVKITERCPLSFLIGEDGKIVARHKNTGRVWYMLDTKNGTSTVLERDLELVSNLQKVIEENYVI